VRQLRGQREHSGNPSVHDHVYFVPRLSLLRRTNVMINSGTIYTARIHTPPSRLLRSRNSLGRGALVLRFVLEVVCTGPCCWSSSSSGGCIETVLVRRPDPMIAKEVEICFRGLLGVNFCSILAGEEGADLRRGLDPFSSGKGVRRRPVAGGVASSPSGVCERLSREDGRCSFSVSEPEPPGGIDTCFKETRELLLAVEDDDEIIG
jgi:hypothetical protein